MGKRFEELNDNLTRFVLSQPVFFVASAPSGDAGHVNVSPKGLAGSLAVLDRSTVAYLDLTGSGVETIAHLRDNGRITLMFCAFEGAPMILRLFGRGEVVMPSEARWEELRARFPDDRLAVRSIILVHIDEARTSCGYGVPLMDHLGDRDDLRRWAERKGPDGLLRYWDEKNRQSLDDLPGLPELPVGSLNGSAS
jgi:hypothetical protein